MKERPILFSPDLRWIKAAAARLKIESAFYASELNAGRKPCGGCGESKPRNAEHFGTDTKTFDGRRSRCRVCVASAKLAHYERTRPEQRARQLAYQRANREKLYAYNAKWSRKRHAALRVEAIAAYGGVCACCGETEPIFLDLDHVNNDGAAHRREIANTTELMLALRAAGWPCDRIQLLCSNCNQGKARNGGVCPHARSR